MNLPRRLLALLFGLTPTFMFGLGGCGYENDLMPLSIPGKNLLDVAQHVVTLATPAQVEAGLAVRNSYIVTFRSEAPARTFGSYLTEYRARYEPLIDGRLSDPRIIDINYVDHVDLIDPKTATFDADLDPPEPLRFAFTSKRAGSLMATIAEVKFRSPEAAKEVLHEWEHDARIWFAEPNYLSYLSDGTFKNLKDQYNPPTGGLWWHEMMNLYNAFDALDTRDPQIADKDLFSPVVAVLDSGLDVTHPAFQDRLWINASPGASGCLNDVNGCDTTVATKGSFGTGNVSPYSVKPDGTCPTSAENDDGYKNCPHGTHVAGIIAAKYSGNFGGVCPFCRILPVKIIAKGEKGGGSASDLAILNGLKYLTRFTQSQRSVVRVINSSFGKYSRSRSVSVLVNVLSRAPNEILLVGAASNEDSMIRTYPASLANAIAVGSLNKHFEKSYFSNYGPWVDVSAPGGGLPTDDPGNTSGVDPLDSKPYSIISTAPGGGSIDKQGTSMACPMVAGVAGLVLAIDRNRSFKNLRASIVGGADPSIYNADKGGGFNFRNYYPKITGDSTRRPLLGSGVVDIKCAIGGTCASGLQTTGKDRVTQGCSSILSSQTTGSSTEISRAILLVLLLTSPLFVVIARSAFTRAR